MQILSDSAILRTKYCENGSIDDLFQSHMSDDISDCMLLYLSQVCHEISNFHNLNIPIGNIKPSNILYDDKFNLYLSDYSQYLLYSDIRQIPLSKIRFFAPEVILGKELTIKSDIWSLGILFYYLLHPHHKILITKTTIKDLYLEMISITKKKRFECLSEERNKFICNFFCKNPDERYTIKDIIGNICSIYIIYYYLYIVVGENRNIKTLDSNLDDESFLNCLTDRNNIDIICDQLQCLYKVNIKKFNKLFEDIIESYNSNSSFSILILIINICLWRRSLSSIVINKIPEDMIFVTPFILLHNIKKLHTLKIDSIYYYYMFIIIYRLSYGNKIQRNK